MVLFHRMTALYKPGKIWSICLKRNEEITALAPYAETQAMLTHHKQVEWNLCQGNFA